MQDEIGALRDHIQDLNQQLSEQKAYYEELLESKDETIYELNEIISDIKKIVS